MPRKWLAIAVFLGFGAPALAQVPVQDAAREVQEKSIADCSTKARATREATIQPVQGVKGSVVSPGQGIVVTAGGADVTGAGAALGGGVVSNMNFGNLLSSGSVPANTVLLQTVAQTVSALASLKSASGQNDANLATIVGVIGALGVIQGSWNQNSGGRASQGALWNQAIMGSTVTAQLWNNRTLALTNGASAVAQGFSYDAGKATLVGDTTGNGNTNALVSSRAP
jgi:hypothetical protein